MSPLTRSNRRSARLRGQSAPNPSPRIRSKRIRTSDRTIHRKRARSDTHMPSLPRSNRCSTRQRRQSAEDSSRHILSKRMCTNNVTTPRKRARADPSPSSAKQLANESKPTEKRCSLNTKLLDLPDEAISRIFYHLGAKDTGGTFTGPRYAFSLAQTNTRLMSIFFSQLTRITPIIMNSHAPAIHPSHIFSVLLRVRHMLRELHLSKLCYYMVPFLHVLCPRIEKLTVEDVDMYSGFQEAILTKLPLRALRIRYPTRITLRLLTSAIPEELSLIKVPEKYIPDELAPIFENPPKRLHLETRSLSAEKLHMLARNLERACPKIEELSVKFPDEKSTADGVFIGDATTYLSVARENEDSKCRKLVLESVMCEYMWELIRLVHPEASVEVIQGLQAFVSDGNGIYAKRIRLYDAYLGQDLSRVSEVVVEEHCNPLWAELLADKYFKRALVTSVETMTYLNLNVKTVDLSIKVFSKMMYSNWEWLNGSSEVRLVEYTDLSTNSEKVDFIDSVSNLLDQFRGKLVWIRTFFKFRLDKKNSVLRRKVTYLRRALNGFEAAGGDAGTIRGILERIRWR